MRGSHHLQILSAEEDRLRVFWSISSDSDTVEEPSEKQRQEQGCVFVENGFLGMMVKMLKLESHQCVFKSQNKTRLLINISTVIIESRGNGT